MWRVGGAHTAPVVDRPIAGRRAPWLPKTCLWLAVMAVVGLAAPDTIGPLWYDLAKRVYFVLGLAAVGVFRYGSARQSTTRRQGPHRRGDLAPSGDSGCRSHSRHRCVYLDAGLPSGAPAGRPSVYRGCRGSHYQGAPPGSDLDRVPLYAADARGIRAGVRAVRRLPRDAGGLCSGHGCVESRGRAPTRPRCDGSSMRRRSPFCCFRAAGGSPASDGTSRCSSWSSPASSISPLARRAAPLRRSLSCFCLRSSSTSSRPSCCFWRSVRPRASVAATAVTVAAATVVPFLIWDWRSTIHGIAAQMVAPAQPRLDSTSLVALVALLTGVTVTRWLSVERPVSRCRGGIYTAA